MLSEDDKRFLLRAARQALESAVLQTPLPRIAERPPALDLPLGAFVTLHEGSDLRGCIGYTEPVKPLAETVVEVTRKAALDDPRFQPVSPEELPSIRIEISVLSPMSRIREIEEIVIGTHGLLLEFEDARGLLLPQVATEYGWDREVFLNQTARKAGLPPASWKDPRAEIYIFSAEIFSETPAA